jgi:PDZ domain-containing protein
VAQHIPAPQADGLTTLEIGPQTSDKVPAPDSRESRPEREFGESQEDEIVKLDGNFHPLDLEDGHQPYLGIELEYSTQCYLGMEEYGFEVVSVDPNSPAARAGLIGRKGSSPWGDVGALGSVLLLGPIALITVPLLRNAGALGMPGDVIVAVGDVRVRTEEEILHTLGHLKPGDTTYITVIRLQGRYHRTMRIALHIDHETDVSGNIVPQAGALPPATPSAATESPVN